VFFSNLLVRGKISEWEKRVNAVIDLTESHDLLGKTS